MQPVKQGEFFYPKAAYYNTPSIMADEAKSTMTSDIQIELRRMVALVGLSTLWSDKDAMKQVKQDDFVYKQYVGHPPGNVVSLVDYFMEGSRYFEGAFEYAENGERFLKPILHRRSGVTYQLNKDITKETLLMKGLGATKLAEERVDVKIISDAGAAAAKTVKLALDIASKYLEDNPGELIPKTPSGTNNHEPYADHILKEMHVRLRGGKTTRDTEKRAEVDVSTMKADYYFAGFMGLMLFGPWPMAGPAYKLQLVDPDGTGGARGTRKKARKRAAEEKQLYRETGYTGYDLDPDDTSKRGMAHKDKVQAARLQVLEQERQRRSLVEKQTLATNRLESLVTEKQAMLQELTIYASNPTLSPEHLVQLRSNLVAHELEIKAAKSEIQVAKEALDNFQPVATLANSLVASAHDKRFKTSAGDSESISTVESMGTAKSHTTATSIRANGGAPIRQTPVVQHQGRGHATPMVRTNLNSEETPQSSNVSKNGSPAEIIVHSDEEDPTLREDERSADAAVRHASGKKSSIELPGDSDSDDEERKMPGKEKDASDVASDDESQDSTALVTAPEVWYDKVLPQYKAEYEQAEDKIKEWDMCCARHYCQQGAVDPSCWYFKPDEPINQPNNKKGKKTAAALPTSTARGGKNRPARRVACVCCNMMCHMITNASAVTCCIEAKRMKKHPYFVENKINTVGNKFVCKDCLFQKIKITKDFARSIGIFPSAEPLNWPFGPERLPTGAPKGEQAAV